MTTPADRAPIPYRPEGQVIFETPRLIGRHLVESDADDMFAVYGDAGAMRWVGDGEPLDRDRCCAGSTSRTATTSRVATE